MNVNLALELLIALISKSQEISLMIQQARGQGREEFTSAEWDVITRADDEARARLAAAIEGRLDVS